MVMEGAGPWGGLVSWGSLLIMGFKGISRSKFGKTRSEGGCAGVAAGEEKREKREKGSH